MNSQPTPQASAAAQPQGAPDAPPRFPLAILFLVWFLVVFITTVVTFTLPESYSSAARIKVERDHTDIAGLQGQQTVAVYDPYFLRTEFEVIKSELILRNVIEGLDLNKKWAKDGPELKTQQTMAMLKGRVVLNEVRNTSLIEVRVFDENASAAASLANQIAQAYQAHRLMQRRAFSEEGIKALERRFKEQELLVKLARTNVDYLQALPGIPDSALADARTDLDDLQQFRRALGTKIALEKTELIMPATSMVEIVDHAVPAIRPDSPNKPFNIMVGFLVGGFSGLFLATLGYVLEHRAYSRKSGILRTKFPPRFRAIAHILIALLVGLFVGYNCAQPSFASFIGFSFWLLLGGIASAYIELASPRPVPASPATPGQTGLKVGL
jgi:capsular polysaccharide biosynthesis protein